MKLFVVGRYLSEEKNQERIASKLSVNHQPWRIAGIFSSREKAIELLEDYTTFWWETESDVNFKDQASVENKDSLIRRVYYKGQWEEENDTTI